MRLPRERFHGARAYAQGQPSVGLAGGVGKGQASHHYEPGDSAFAILLAASLPLGTATFYSGTAGPLAGSSAVPPRSRC